jgi:hypothetical protein
MSTHFMDRANGTYFTVETWNVDYRVTRRIVCRDLDTAYTVAAQLRKRLVRHGYATLPMPTTTIRLTEFVGRPKWSGCVIASSLWEGRPTMREAIEAARSARWLAIDPAHTAGGACIPMPERRGVRISD